MEEPFKKKCMQIKCKLIQKPQKQSAGLDTLKVKRTFLKPTLPNNDQSAEQLDNIVETKWSHHLFTYFQKLARRLMAFQRSPNDFHIQ